jgi:hypothetical protein
MLTLTDFRVNIFQLFASGKSQSKNNTQICFLLKIFRLFLSTKDDFALDDPFLLSNTFETSKSVSVR